MRIRVLIVFAALVLGIVPASAARDGVQPLDRILSRMRHDRAGTFYDADGPFPDSNGNMHYRIKWLTPEGRLIWLDTDARTGRVLGTEHGNSREEPPPREEEPRHGGDRFDNDHGPGGGYNDQPRENFPRDPRWPRWQNGDPAGGGRWLDRGDGGGRDRGGHHGHDGE